MGHIGAKVDHWHRKSMHGVESVKLRDCANTANGTTETATCTGRASGQETATIETVTALPMLVPKEMV